MHADDKALIEAFQKGDDFAFVSLYNRYKGPVYTFCLKMLFDRDLAQDVMQETFLRAYKSIRRFRLEARFSTWLYRIATNQCLTRLGRRSKVRPESLEQLQERHGVVPDALRSDDDQEANLLAEERQQQVREALVALPIDQRLAVELKFFQERTFEEIGEILEASPSTIKSRLYVGLEALKKRLAKGTYGEGTG